MMVFAFDNLPNPVDFLLSGIDFLPPHTDFLMMAGKGFVM